MRDIVSSKTERELVRININDENASWNAIETATVRTINNGEQEITATVDGKEFTITEAFVRRHLQLADVEDEGFYDKWDDRVERATTTAASLDAAQASVPGAKKPQGDSLAQTRSERVPTQPHDSPLPRVNTLGSDEGSLQLQELMALCIKLSDRVLALETDLR
ncbi:hypothetical protein Tco_0074246 [Tanacetum coccineum]